MSIVSSTAKKPKASVNLHDEFVRAVFAHTEIVIDFLELYLRRTKDGQELLRQIDLKRIKLETPHFVGEEGRERIADLIFTIPLKKGQGSTGVVFVFEHKSKRTRSLPFQLLKYLIAIWNKIFSEVKNPESEKFELPAPLLVVLHNGAKPIIDKPTLEQYIAKVAGTHRFIPKFDYELVDLPALSIEELGKAPLLRVILELLKRATDGTLYDVRQQILEPLTVIRDDETTRYWIQRILRYMDKALKRSKKELTPDLIDQVIKPVYKERSTNMSLTFLEKLELRGKTAGIAEGRAEGEARGEQNAVLAILRKKFKRVPAKTETTIRSMSDSIALESLAVQAAVSQTLDEFTEALR